MKHWRPYWLGLLISAGLTPALWAQIPAAPAVAAPVGAAPAAAPAAPASLWTFLCPDMAKVAACKAKFCACPLGQLITNMMAPAAAMSGGILGNCCPKNAPDPADLAKSSDTPAGAAAKIKADEMAAKKRREDVRYLGTVDCHYWPEAEKALINALRADRNECVRMEAATVLGRGCCCTKNTIVALSITVAGSNRDGNPSENCERVKAAATASLAHCLACLADTVPLSLEPPQQQQKKDIREGPIEKLPPVPAAYYEQVDKASLTEIVAVARRVLAKANTGKAQAAPDVAHSGAFNIIANAVASSPIPSGKPGIPGNVETTSGGTVEMVTADPPRGILSSIARHVAPTPLDEGQAVDSSFKTQPFFLRDSQEGRVAVMTPAQPLPVTQMGQPTAVVGTQITTLPVVTTAPSPVMVTPGLSAPRPATITFPAPPLVTTTPPLVAPALPPAAPKQSPTGVVQTSYLANVTNPIPISRPLAQPAAAPAPQAASAAPSVPSDFPKYVRDLIVTAKAGKSCEEGLAAVFSLANSDWRTHPEVVMTLATAARQSPMLPVRITAIRCLAGIRVNNGTVRGTLQALKNDVDPTVRTEAEQALNSLVFYTPPGDSSVRR